MTIESSSATAGAVRPDDAELPKGTVLSLYRGLQLLEAVIDARDAPRITDLARVFGMDKAAVFRFLRTLEQAGLVTKDSRRKTYTAGRKLLHWAAALGSQTRIVALARPYLEGLVARTGESGHVGILHDDQALLLDYLAADAMVVVRNRVGVYEPLYATAVGKALLAFQPDARRRQLLQQMELRPHTPRTLTTVDEVETALDEVRRTGIALDNAEYHDILYCVASPILDPDGKPLAAIGVSMVKALVADRKEHLERVRGLVRGCAVDLTAAIAGHTAGRAGPAADGNAPG